MKHYVLRNGRSHWTGSAPWKSERLQHVDVILAGPEARASAHMIDDFFRAVNDLVENHRYVVNMRVLADEPVGGPLYWAGRPAVFWGDIHGNWPLSEQEKAWCAQVVNLSPRTILVGGAVLLFGQVGRAANTVAAIHPNFAAAAQEIGLIDSGTGSHLASDGRVHSASTRLSALRLLAEFLAADHGAHLADTLRSYIGLEEPKPSCNSHLAIRLVQRSGADPLVRRTIETMLEHLEDPLRISELSGVLATSTRQLQRRFLNKTGTKLLTTYRELRLEHAHSLLRNTDLSYREVSAATGFSSAVALTRAFRDHYETTPETIRNQRFGGELSTLQEAR